MTSRRRSASTRNPAQVRQQVNAVVERPRPRTKLLADPPEPAPLPAALGVADSPGAVTSA